MENLIFTINAVLPIILIIALGYFLRRINFFDEKFLSVANKLCYKVCLPTLLFFNVYNIDSLAGINWKFILFIVLTILGLFIFGFIIVKVFVSNDKQKGVILQCSFRSNYAIIGIPLAIALAGEGSLAVGVASIVSAISIPLFNILAVISLSIFEKGEEGKIDIKNTLVKIVKNPLILGVFTGVIVLGIRYLLGSLNIDFSIKNDLSFLYKTIQDVSRVATPLALIVLGGQFTFSAVKDLRFQIILGTSLRVLITPIVCLSLAYLVGFRSVEFPALIALFGTPTAVSSVPMAAEMNQDDKLAGQLVVWTTIISAFTLFTIIMICKSIGLL